MPAEERRGWWRCEDGSPITNVGDDGGGLHMLNQPYLIYVAPAFFAGSHEFYGAP